MLSNEELLIQESELFGNASALFPHVFRHEPLCTCDFSMAFRRLIRAAFTPYYELPDNVYPPPPHLNISIDTSATPPSCPPCHLRRAHRALQLFVSTMPPPRHKWWESYEVAQSWSPMDIYARLRYGGFMQYVFTSRAMELQEKWRQEKWFSALRNPWRSWPVEVASTEAGPNPGSRKRYKEFKYVYPEPSPEPTKQSSFQVVKEKLSRYITSFVRDMKDFLGFDYVEYDL